MSGGEKSTKKKVKIKTQNEKIAEMDMVYGTKHIKNSYLSQEEIVKCKQRHELSAICL